MSFPLAADEPMKIRKSILVYTEGKLDAVFLKYLQSQFSYEFKNVVHKIRQGRGGAADKIVSEAVKELGKFTKRVVVLDNDKDSVEMERARQKASEKNILLFENVPCLEGLFLQILNDGVEVKLGSAHCKEAFHSKHIPEKARCDLSEYRRVFPKKLLEEQCVKIPILHSLVSLMKGEY